MREFSIRPVTTMKEIHGIVDIQRQAWKMSDLEIVATFEMKAVSNFGVLLIAVDRTDTPIGFIYGFPQFPNSHYSHMMATLPEWQGEGIGFEMKKYHRNIALRSPYNIQWINWTVDPLLSNNAYLNFAKLGCVCSIYYENYYGEPDDVGIYRGVPTDRFYVNWHIRDQRVNNRLDDYKSDRIDSDNLFTRSPCINLIEKNKWVDKDETSIDNSFTLQIPEDYQNIKQNSLELAMDWRLKFRKLCQDYFSNSWQVIDFHSFKDNNSRKNYYEFEKIKEK